MSIIDYYKTHEDFNMIDCYNISIHNERLTEKIYENLQWHHSGYRYPVKAEYWEDIWDKCINPQGSDWVGGGHQSGADTKHNITGISYQNKSGTINDNIVSFTSHRLKSRGETLKQKIEFLSEDHCDKYVLLSRDKNEWENGIKAYKLMIFNSKLINFRELKWIRDIPKRGKNKGKHTGKYKGIEENNNYSARIDGPGTSHQLHIDIKLDYIGGYHEFIIP